MKKVLAFILICIMITVSCCTAFADEWVCQNCGRTNTGNFCPDCGAKHDIWTCANCGTENTSNYCENCGTARTVDTQDIILIMEGHSMEDTICDGDFLNVEYRTAAEMNRFDLVVVKYPGREHTQFIKRLIGLPGDTVELKDGYLYLNGEKYDEPYVYDAYRTGSRNTFGPETVPANQYFVLGDHRNNSNDSRYVGALPAEMMIGVITKINGKDYVNIYASAENNVPDSQADQSLQTTGLTPSMQTETAGAEDDIMIKRALDVLKAGWKEEYDKYGKPGITFILDIRGVRVVRVKDGLDKKTNERLKNAKYIIDFLFYDDYLSEMMGSSGHNVGYHDLTAINNDVIIDRDGNMFLDRHLIDSYRSTTYETDYSPIIEYVKDYRDQYNQIIEFKY